MHIVFIYKKWYIANRKGVMVLYTYLVYVSNDMIEQETVFAGSNKKMALETFKKCDNNFEFTNTWIQIWKNGEIMNDCWEPTKEDFLMVESSVSTPKVELNRHDIRFKGHRQNQIIFEDRFNEEYYLVVKELYVEETENLGKEQLTFEAAEEDWFVFRNKYGKVFLLYRTGENTEVFATINQEIVKQHDQRIPSEWLQANIYGYCNGFFDRSHYFVNKHEIEAVGKDWIVARDVDDPLAKGRVYLAHFDKEAWYKDTYTTEELLKEWSQKIDM